MIRSINDTGILSQQGVWRGLQAYWRMNSTGGTTAYDYVGGYNGTVSTGTWNSGGKNGYCLYNSSNSVKAVECGDVLDFEYTDTMTYHAWVKRNGTGTHDVIFWKNITSAPQHGIEMRITAGNQLNFYIATSYATQAVVCQGTTTTVSSGAWYMCTCTWNGAISPRNQACLEMYVNAVKQTKNLETNNAMSSLTVKTNTQFAIGSRNASTYYSFPGYLDELAVWNRVLSQDEITALYNAGNGIFY